MLLFPSWSITATHTLSTCTVYLARDAVEPLAERAVVRVDLVADEAPSLAVGRLAVERVLGRGLSLLKRLLLELLVHLAAHQLE